MASNQSSFPSSSSSSSSKSSWIQGHKPSDFDPAKRAGSTGSVSVSGSSSSSGKGGIRTEFFSIRKQCYKQVPLTKLFNKQREKIAANNLVDITEKENFKGGRRRSRDKTPSPKKVVLDVNISIPHVLKTPERKRKSPLQPLNSPEQCYSPPLFSSPEDDNLKIRRRLELASPAKARSSSRSRSPEVTGRLPPFAATAMPSPKKVTPITPPQYKSESERHVEKLNDSASILADFNNPPLISSPEDDNFKIQRRLELELSPTKASPRSRSPEVAGRLPLWAAMPSPTRSTPIPRPIPQQYKNRRQREELNDTAAILADFNKLPNRDARDDGNKAMKPVRKKDERAQLPGWTCDLCQNYYAGLEDQMHPSELERLMAACSKHKSKTPIVPINSPPGAWLTTMPSTEEAYRLGYMKMGSPLKPVPRKRYDLLE